MMNKIGIQGVVLCGGQSSRMGTDKGLIVTQSVTWTQLAINKLAALNLSVVISVNETQYSTYLLKFKDATIVKDHAAIEVYGPLKGLLSVHLKHPAKDLLVLACDMPHMHQQVLQELLMETSKANSEALVFRSNEQIEPLCAAYSAKGLDKIYNLYLQGQLKKNSLHYLLENLKTTYLPVHPDWSKYFANYNSPSDLSSL